MQTVVLRSFDNYFKANIILGRLQENGINCFLQDEYSVTINPIFGNAIGGIKLAVDALDSERCIQLLKEFDEEYIRSAVCPQCRRYEIELVTKKGSQNIISTLFIWLFSNYAVSMENVYQCQHCGYESSDLPENTAVYN